MYITFHVASIRKTLYVIILRFRETALIEKPREMLTNSIIFPILFFFLAPRETSC